MQRTSKIARLPRPIRQELNRLLTDHLSTLLFCPTDEAVRNLSKEGINNGMRGQWVKNVGDVMHDSILYYSRIADQKSTILQDLRLLPSSQSLTRNSELGTPNYYLATLHRAENTDDPRRLKSILKALDEISDTASVVLPLHPRTKKRMESHRLQPKSKKVKLIEPVSYLNMLKLEKNAKTILTDSGGVQKEAYWLGVPCVTLREVTEWGYTVKEGWNIVSGWKTSDILQAIQRILDRKRRKGADTMRKKTASEKIVQILLDHSGN